MAQYVTPRYLRRSQDQDQVEYNWAHLGVTWPRTPRLPFSRTRRPRPKVSSADGDLRASAVSLDQPSRIQNVAKRYTLSAYLVCSRAPGQTRPSPAFGHRSGLLGQTPSASAWCAQSVRSVWTTRSSSTSDTCMRSSPSTSTTTTSTAHTEASVCRARCLEAQLATVGSSGDRC